MLSSLTATSHQCHILLLITHTSPSSHNHDFKNMNKLTDTAILVHVYYKCILQLRQNRKNITDFQVTHVMYLLPIKYPFYPTSHNNLTFKSNNKREYSPSPDPHIICISVKSRCVHNLNQKCTLIEHTALLALHLTII
jgi:hypothetical protein